MSPTNLAFVVSIALGLLLQPWGVSAQPDEAAASIQQQIHQVIDGCLPAVVEIQRRGAVFSGVIVSPNGHVLTAGHTVAPGERYTVILPDGRRFSGQALGACEQMRGERIDCGLIRIQQAANLPFIPLGDSSSLASGQLCLSISYPGGQRPDNQPVVRLGRIERPSRAGRMLQSTALMEPGDSGGPLVDLSGRVIAIHSRIGTRMEQNYDVPINTFKTYWDALNAPQTFAAANGQVVPKLGFVGQDQPDGTGIAILSVVDGSLAQNIGLQPDDVLMRIQDRDLAGMRDLHTLLLSAIESQSEEVALSVRRGQEEREYVFSSQRLSIPVAERITGLDSDAPSQTSAPAGQLEYGQDLDRTRAELSGRLDDTCCLITSHLSGKTITAVATRIADSKYLVSKSSLVGLVPFMGEGDPKQELTIVARNSDWDLVLLVADQENLTGVRLSKEPEIGAAELSGSQLDAVRMGQIVYSPTPNSDGLLSIVGGSPFYSPREASRGYLGVVLRDYQDQGVELVEVDNGAAMQAGLRPGDLILALNQQPVRQRQEIMQLLRWLDPNTIVDAKIQRNSQQFEVKITLGSRPEASDHAADMMKKSLRRDGFSKVFCHDATLTPELCGGPVFGLDGQWLGLNIARYSRVRTFAIPADAVAEFVRQYRDQ